MVYHPAMGSVKLLFDLWEKRDVEENVELTNCSPHKLMEWMVERGLLRGSRRQRGYFLFSFAMVLFELVAVLVLCETLLLKCMAECANHSTLIWLCRKKKER